MLSSFSMIEPMQAGGLDFIGVLVWLAFIVIGIAVKASKNAKGTTTTASTGGLPPPRRPFGGFAPPPPEPAEEDDDEPVAAPAHTIALGTPFASEEDEMDGPTLPPLRGSVAPSRQHAMEHVGAPAPEGTVPPPVAEPAPTAAMAVHMPMSCPAHGKLSRVKLPRTAEALRTAMIFNEVIGRPRAYDV